MLTIYARAASAVRSSSRATTIPRQRSSWRTDCVGKCLEHSVIEDVDCFKANSVITKVEESTEVTNDLQPSQKVRECDERKCNITAYNKFVELNDDGMTLV